MDEERERQNGPRDQYGRLISDYMDPEDAKEDHYVNIMSNILGFEYKDRRTDAADTIEAYTKAVEKASAATAEVATQQSKLRESTLMLAQAELDKTLREEMQAEILQQAKAAYA